jgi:hypothetical protein
MIGCRSGWGAAVFFTRSGGHFSFINSRIDGTTALESSDSYKHSVGYNDLSSSVRIVGGTIRNVSSHESKFTIWDDSAADFGVQIDSVVVDDTVSIYSNGTKVLLQNCEGFTSTAVAKAEIATCASTADYCLRDSCVDSTVGIDCLCVVDGVQTLFPTDCMQSAEIKVILPSTHTLTYIIQKPLNETAELLLSNVRARTLKPRPPPDMPSSHI